MPTPSLPPAPPSPLRLSWIILVSWLARTRPVLIRDDDSTLILVRFLVGWETRKMLEVSRCATSKEGSHLGVALVS